MLSSTSWPGWPSGVLTKPPGVIEPQWPAVTTCVGVTSVPVHWKTRSMVMWATKGYSPGDASLPPTMACAGAAAPSARTTVARRVRVRFMRTPTARAPGTGADRWSAELRLLDVVLRHPDRRRVVAVGDEEVGRPPAAE